MTCEQYEGDLALHAGGDLPEDQVARLEGHLAECARCQSLYRGLEGTVGALRSLAAEPLRESALATVRARTLAAAFAPRRVARVWVSAAAAAVAFVALTTVARWAGKPAGRHGHSPAVIVEPPAAPAHLGGVVAPPAQADGAHRPARAFAQATTHRADSTTHKSRRVFRSMGSQSSDPLPALSPEEADQLARALVALSGVERLSDWPVDMGVGQPSPPLMRITTADPDVVIYWELESNGG